MIRKDLTLAQGAIEKTLRPCRTFVLTPAPRRLRLPMSTRRNVKRLESTVDLRAGR